MNPHLNMRKTVKWAGAALSAVLIAAWIASAWCAVGGIYQTRYGVGLNSGQLWYYNDQHGYETDFPTKVDFHFHAPSLRWGFDLEWNFDRLGLQMPLWVIVAPLLVVTAIAWRRDKLASFRARVGHCATCGYNLSATPAASRCPECGAGHI